MLFKDSFFGVEKGAVGTATNGDTEKAKHGPFSPGHSISSDYQHGRQTLASLSLPTTIFLSLLPSISGQHP